MITDTLPQTQKPPQTRTQFVADVLRERILKGQVAGGEALTQQAIAEEFSVSRIPVREALLLLQSEGLVELLPHKGATVVELSAHKITELFELRGLLEVSLLKAAIPSMTENDFAQAEQILNTFNDALNNEESIERWSEYNQQFHQILYAPSRKSETLSLVNILNVRCSRYVRMQLLYTQKIHKAQDEHAAILQLCRDKHIDKACELLHNHIIESCESIIELLQSNRYQR